MEIQQQEGEPQPSEPMSLWVPILSLAGALLASSIVAAILLGSSSASSTSTTANQFLVEEIVLWAFFLAGVVFASRRYLGGHPVSDFGLRIRPWPDIPLGLFIGVLCQVLLIPAIYLPIEHFDSSVRRSLSQPAQNIVGIGRNGGEVIVALVTVVIAPIVEELFFRGLVLKTIRSRFQSQDAVISKVVAVVGSALFFALAHFEPLQFVGLFVVGCVLGAIAIRTKGIGMSIFVHMGFNLIAFVALASSGTVR